MVQKEKIFIGISEVSKLTGISVSTLYKLTAVGVIPYYKPTGKLLFKESEIISWIESSRVEATQLPEKE